jgi:hypothetical protein
MLHFSTGTGSQSDKRSCQDWQPVALSEDDANINSREVTFLSKQK